MNIYSWYLLALISTTNAIAQSLPDSDMYLLKGYINISDFENFSAKFAAGTIRTVKFENCYGGNGLAGFRFAEKIKKEKLITVASGVVASSCAFAFLGGSVRKIDRKAEQTTLVFHGTYYPGTLAPKGPRANQEFLDIFEKYIGFKFSPVVQRIIINSKVIDEGAYFMTAPHGSRARSTGYYCDGKLPFNSSTCVNLPGITMESEGFLTE